MRATCKHGLPYALIGPSRSERLYDMGPTCIATDGCVAPRCIAFLMETAKELYASVHVFAEHMRDLVLPPSDAGESPWVLANEAIMNVANDADELLNLFDQVSKYPWVDSDTQLRAGSNVATDRIAAMTKPITPDELIAAQPALAPEAIEAMNELLALKWHSPSQYAIVYCDDFFQQVQLVRKKLGIEPIRTGIPNHNKVENAFTAAGWNVTYTPFSGGGEEGGSSPASWKFTRK